MRLDRDTSIVMIICIFLLGMFLDLLFFEIVPPPGDILLPYKTYSSSIFWVTKTSQLKGYALILGAKAETAFLINLSFPIMAWIARERRKEVNQFAIPFLVLMGGVLGLFALKQAPFREGSLIDPFLGLYIVLTFSLFELARRLKLRTSFHFILQFFLLFYSFWTVFFVLAGD